MGLTFYLVRAESDAATSKAERIVCGQVAETTGGSRGIVLCEQYAEVHGFNLFKRGRAVSGGKGS